MSLNWDTSKIKDLAGLEKDNAQEVNKTTMITWLTLIVGVAQITDKNVDLIFNRYCLYSKLFDLYKNLLKKEDFVSRIGLITNAPNFSKTQFKKLINDRMSREFKL